MLFMTIFREEMLRPLAKKTCHTFRCANHEKKTILIEQNQQCNILPTDKRPHH